MPLTDIAIRNAAPREKPYKIHDMLGLFLAVLPSGSKMWRMKYKQAGVEKKLSFGRYPEVSLRDARKRRDDARDQIYDGKDPARLQKLVKLRSQPRGTARYHRHWARRACHIPCNHRPAESVRGQAGGRCGPQQRRLA